ncbi:MAG: type II toxin-antitoxin system VapC family toxin [Candidatus Nezhaarchaeales archaeon]
MIYLDTNVLIAYINPRDKLHDKAINLLSQHRDEDFAVSQLVILELYSVFSRVMELSDDELEALVNYAIKVSNAKNISIEWDDICRLAPRYANKLKLKVLDLLHVIAAYSTGIKRFMSFDKDINDRAEVIEKLLGIEVIGL